MSIIGNKKLIPHFRHRKNARIKGRDPKVSEKYDKRARMLSKLGYASYSEYLESEDWKVIRSRVLAAWPKCVMCDHHSEVAHHVKYWDSVLLGLDDAKLAPLCHACHESIELEAGKKNSLPSANNKLFQAARRTANGLAWAAAYYRSFRSAPKGRA